MKLEQKTLSGALPLLPLTSDLAFKAVYGQDTPQSNEALRALLNRLLLRDDDPIQWVRCRNPFHYRTYTAEKESIMDVKVQLSSGQLLNLEMEVSHLRSFTNRAIHYLGKLINESLAKGESYDRMKESILISIVDGTLFPHRREVYSRYFLMEETYHEPLSSITQLNFLELGKISFEKPVEEMSPHERIGAFFKCAADESRRGYIQQLQKFEPEVIGLSQPLLEIVSADDKLRFEIEARERYEHDVATMKSEARTEGLEEGRAEGREKGLEEGRKEAAARINALNARLIEAQRFEELKAATKDPVLQKALLKEYNL